MLQNVILMLYAELGYLFLPLLHPSLVFLFVTEFQKESSNDERFIDHSVLSMPLLMCHMLIIVMRRGKKGTPHPCKQNSSLGRNGSFGGRGEFGVRGDVAVIVGELVTEVTAARVTFSERGSAE